ncbi:MAG: isoprenylcysteine carboxylmethyltransferase family protein [Candidatus Lokiarchaeota archaeon]|nr:isoprenylcysteine carboxylmethyltransferase family protein [Candidatus Lokiarchaeota archaeon]
MSNELPQNKKDKSDKPLPLWGIALIPIYISALFIIILFPLAQDWTWIEAWLFILSFVVNFTISYYLINKKNPRVIRNRMKIKKVGVTEKTKKTSRSDLFIMPLLSIGFFGAMILPPFDYRFQWTTIPFYVEIIGLVILNFGLIIIDFAMVQNAYASKILDINKDQKLIDTGLYGHVRHPLYTGAILMILGLPIALGSWISLIPAAIGVLALIIRIKFEEKMLIKGMDGYEDYRTRVKYKLIPKIY